VCIFFFAATDIQLQRKLLERENHDLKPDDDFLELFADVVGSKWTSLATSLSLRERDIKEVEKEEELTQQKRALKMLQIWSKRKNVTLGELCCLLKTITLFQCCSSEESSSTNRESSVNHTPKLPLPSSSVSSSTPPPDVSHTPSVVPSVAGNKHLLQEESELPRKKIRKQ